MSNIKKLMMSAAGGEALNVEDVFSTYLYTGNNSNGSQTNTITNGIDLDGEGGLVWIKNRTDSFGHYLFDSSSSWLKTGSTSGAGSYGGATLIFDGVSSTGFTVKSDFPGVNFLNKDYVSWTFRKAPKFFDVVTYTGNGSNTNVINHNLGVVPGFIIIKNTSTPGYNWTVQHRSLSSKYLELNLTNAAQNGYLIDPITSTTFNVLNSGGVNTNGDNYVAYLFAHNDGDGEFGPDSDQDIIKCGSYTGAGYGAADEFNVDLGFEPQWILYKRTDSSAGGGWFMVDNMRGWRPETSSNFEYLQAQSSDAEAQSGSLGIRSDGFRVREGSGRNYIYMAIRRGTKAPESATEVFKTYDLTSASLNTQVSTSFPPDMSLHLSNDGNKLTVNRLTGGIHAYPTGISPRMYLTVYNTDAESTTNYGVYYDFNSTSFKVSYNGYSGQSDSPYAYMWKRAPGFFDVVAYTGNNTTQTVSHNLGVAPELVIVKSRSASGHWRTLSTSLSQYTNLNTTGAFASAFIETLFGNNTAYVAPTETQFTLGSDDGVNNGSVTYIAYLFASLPGISKVGSYTGNGTSQTINCGFSGGARFILIKRTDSTGNWYVWDTERGIVAGDEQHTVLNVNTGKGTDDSVDPANSGFIVNQVSATNINVSSASYIFYAIA